MRSAEACPLPIWRSYVASPLATAPTRYADGKSEARADRRANCFAYWRWQAIDIRSLKISTSSTASTSTRKTGPRAGKPFARICGTRSAAAHSRLLLIYGQDNLGLMRARQRARSILQHWRTNGRLLVMDGLDHSMFAPQIR